MRIPNVGLGIFTPTSIYGISKVSWKQFIGAVNSARFHLSYPNIALIAMALLSVWTTYRTSLTILFFNITVFAVTLTITLLILFPFLAIALLNTLFPWNAYECRAIINTLSFLWLRVIELIVFFVTYAYSVIIQLSLDLVLLATV